MENQNDKIRQLEEQLQIAIKRQSTLNSNLKKIQSAIQELRSSENSPSITVAENQPKSAILKKESIPNTQVESTIDPAIVTKRTTADTTRKPLEKSGFEKFIGENLISKIGIIILVIGVGIGGKYAIDNELISPLTRIILGYILGVGLLGTAIYLKTKYESLSAVILSGSVAIFYIITFLAYSLYGLMPQTMAFALLLIFTVFTVIAAIQYNKQVIALFGLVGAYAIPFLLSNGSGRFDIFFSFITIVNIGILAVSIAKYWKLLNYISFGFTWLIFGGWLASEYESEHFSLALTFATIFYLVFYLTFILNKIIKSEKFSIGDVVVITLNTFIYYFIGYGLLDNHLIGQNYLGLFTVILAIINFATSYLFYIKKSADKNLLLYTIGLVLVFITIAIPVQFDGYVVTISWAGISAVLFWIARSKQMPRFEWLAYPIVIIASASLINDWSNYYLAWNDTPINPIFNIGFVSTSLYAIALILITYFIYSPKYNTETKDTNVLRNVVSIAIPTMVVLSIFNLGRLEISAYFDGLFNSSSISPLEDTISFFNNNLLDLKTTWLTIYVLIFASICSLVEQKWFKNNFLSYTVIIVLALSIIHFLSVGLLSISELRENYLERDTDLYFKISGFNIGIRYLAIAIVSCALILLKETTNRLFKVSTVNIALTVFIYGSILWLLSSELIHLISMARSNIAYKLSLSILWGVYSLFLVSIGIWKERSYLRIMGIALFGITLLKLFLYDIAHLSTISKTIVFVALGILLLIVSFLYNKFKHKISPDE